MSSQYNYAQAWAESAVKDIERGTEPSSFSADFIRSHLRWRGGLKGLALIPPVIVGLVLLGNSMVNSGPTCGGRKMRPGDRCVNLKTGSSSSADQVSGAAVNQWWFWLVLIAILVIVWFWLLRARRVPGKDEKEYLRTDFVAAMTGLQQAMDQQHDPAMVERLEEYEAQLYLDAHQLARKMRVDLDAPAAPARPTPSAPPGAPTQPAAPTPPAAPAKPAPGRHIDPGPGRHRG